MKNLSSEQIQELIKAYLYSSSFFKHEDNFFIMNETFWTGLRARGPSLKEHDLAVEKNKKILIHCFENAQDVLDFSSIVSQNTSPFNHWSLKEQAIYVLWLHALIKFVPDNTLNEVPEVWHTLFIHSSDKIKKNIIKAVPKLKHNTAQIWLKSLKSAQESLALIMEIDKQLHCLNLTQTGKKTDKIILCETQRVFYEKEFEFNLSAFYHHLEYCESICRYALSGMKKMLEKKYSAHIEKKEQLHIFIRTDAPETLDEITHYVRALCDFMFIDLIQTVHETNYMDLFETSFPLFFLRYELDKKLTHTDRTGRSKI